MTRTPMAGPYRLTCRNPRLWTIVALSATLAACGGGSGGSTGDAGTGATEARSRGHRPTQPTGGSTTPAIATFTASPTLVTSGQATTLTWSVTNATTVTISPNVGTVTGTTATVDPTSTTTYTLTASNTGGQKTATVTVTVGTSTSAHYATLAGADLGAGANLNGALPFPADNAWNTDISKAQVDPNSANLISSIGLTTGLHPDFGSGTYNGGVIGIPYVVVSSSQAPVAIKITGYPSQSDPGPFPVPDNAPIEGEPANAATGGPGGDKHVLVIDRDTNRLYEMWQSTPTSFGVTGSTWSASTAALFHLDSDVVRPTAGADWTSADAAGLPIFPGLIRYEEANAGAIKHALRFTVDHTRKAYVPPADHYASTNTSANLPPMGMRVRLKASYVIPSTFSPQTQAILQAMKTYGMFVADNGSNWYISGAPDSRWNDDALDSQLSQVKGSDFEVVLMTGLVTP